jgi:hypothetical protein
MAHSFKSNPARPAFGVFAEPLQAGEYIYNKKVKATYCGTNNCPSRVKLDSQNNLLLFKRSTRFCLKNMIDKTNLNINLITELDLKDVPVIADFSGNVPTTILSTNIPYLDYNIDPNGDLFGNTICGVNNYVQYMKYNTLQNR